MIETPVRFIRGILGYKKDPEVRMDDFEEYLSVGETAPDFTLQTVHGTEWSLSDHRGEYVVLEFGSYTCPMFRRQISGMAQVARQLASDEVSFVLVYQKEAHPNQGSSSISTIRMRTRSVGGWPSASIKRRIFR